MTSATIQLQDVTKTFDGKVVAVDGVTLDIAAGEFFSLLGPSGCGKTTSLRMIAGFERPDSGRVHVGGQDITDVAVHRRDMGMVFQSYALFPHRTVAQNVAFGLRMRDVAKAEIDRRVAAALAQVALTGLEDRRPGQLSGGQQQRVALARALVIEPRVLLCDEPLGALDRKLRQQMQFELKELQRRLGVTLVFVTHDQEEALAMSDRIAVMNHGRVEQVGAPTAIYERPRTRFVADFIGEINIVEPEHAGKPRALRPEKIRLVPAGAARLSGIVETANFLGGATLYRVQAGGRTWLARETHAGERSPRGPGDPVGLAWNDIDMVTLDS
jgi:putative spermidine/putrescine transport system ATP-binding protein